MNYFTALGITVAIIGGIFLFIIMAVPFEIVTPYFTPIVQVLSACVIAGTYIGSFRWLKIRNKVA